MPHLWQERLRNIHSEELQQGQSYLCHLLFVTYKENATAVLLNEEAFTKLIASNKHFGSAVPGEQI
jgi:hypothetical protein